MGTQAAENLVDAPSEILENLDGTSGTDGTNGANETKEMTENEYDSELEHRFQSSRSVSILSHTHTRTSHDFAHDHEHEHEHDHHTAYNTIQPKTTTGWLFASESSWTLRHNGGSRQDTHGTPVPEREGRGWPTTDDLRRTTVRQRRASDKRGFRKTSTDRRAVNEDRCLTDTCILTW